jgi:hypothetical protein
VASSAKKYLQRVGNGVKDGRQTEGGEKAKTAEKVVRLPRDWLGPREDLVPFGRRASAPAPESSPSALSSQAPPSAADFWGERSAAIHGALEVPADAQANLGADSSGRLAAARLHRFVPRFGPRTVVAVTGLAICAATVAVLATGVLAIGGSALDTAGNARLNVAAVLNEAVSRTLQRGLAILAVSAEHRQATAATRHRSSTVRPTQSDPPALKHVRDTSQSHSSASFSSGRPASRAVVRASAPASVRPLTHAISSGSGPTVHPERSSSATVSPTGQSGALGPVESPNG